MPTDPEAIPSNANTGPARSSVTRPRRQRWRWPIAGAIVAVGAGVLLASRIWPGIDAQSKTLFLLATPAGTLLALYLWFAASMTWTVRNALVAITVLAMALGVFPGALKIDEVDGDLVPRLAWRWSRKADYGLKTAVDAVTPVDLTATTQRDSPQFLGPNRDGRFAGPALARNWSAQPPKELWRRPIGAGFGSFAVVGDWAVTQEQRGDDEMIVCYDLRTGEIAWTHSDPVRFEEVIGGVGPRSTPTIVEGRVYSMGATGMLNCLDGATGDVVWSRDVLGENELTNLEWGHACSPLVVDDLVIVTGGAGRTLLAYDKKTGDEVWRAGEERISYSSPQLVDLAGVRHIAIVHGDSVAGHSLEDGRLLWRFDWPAPNPKCTQPVVLAGDRLLASAGYGVGSVMLSIAAAGEGAAAELTCKQLWDKRSQRNLKSKFSNMILHDGHVYGLDDGILTCLDAETGKRIWKDGRYGHGQLLLVGDLLLVQTEPGPLVLVAATPDGHQELATIPALEGTAWELAGSVKTWNNPAFSPPYLLLRNHEQAVCYEMPLAIASQKHGVATKSSE